MKVAVDFFRSNEQNTPPHERLYRNEDEVDKFGDKQWFFDAKDLDDLRFMLDELKSLCGWVVTSRNPDEFYGASLVFYDFADC